jgi:hypothetical protein
VRFSSSAASCFPQQVPTTSPRTAKIHSFSHFQPGPIALPISAAFASSSGFGDLPLLSPHSHQVHRVYRGALLNGCSLPSPADGASSNSTHSASTSFTFPLTTMNSKSASPSSTSTPGAPKRRRKTQTDDVSISRPNPLDSPPARNASPIAANGGTGGGMTGGTGTGVGTGAGTGGGATSSFRNVSACNRCRLRKNRCDQRLPACQSCEKAVRRLAQALFFRSRFTPRRMATACGSCLSIGC